MVRMSGGEALVASLVREGVEVVFGIPGIHLSGIIAALRDEPSIKLIQTRHEQGAAHMADGYAMVSGKPGVMLLVPGAGLYNAASGIASAYARSSPVLAIVGQIPRAQIGKGVGAVHEVLDQAEVVRPVTKWRRQILRPREAPDAVTDAFRQMRTGRPRPVLIELPPETGVSARRFSCVNPPRCRASCQARMTFAAPSISSWNHACLLSMPAAVWPNRTRKSLSSGSQRPRIYQSSRQAAARGQSRTGIRCPMAPVSARAPTHRVL